MQHPLSKWLPIGWALKASLSHGYGFTDFKSDLQAAFVVSLIALPLSMALAIAIGLPPQHGIITAVVAGCFASLLGGSSFQISGPTAAFVVILIPIITDFGYRGLIWCQILAGCLLILMGILRIGKLIHYVPDTIVIGFTSAIALSLALLSLKDLLGLPIDQVSHHFIEKISLLVQFLPQIHIPDTIIGLFTLFLVVTLKGKIRWIPSPMLAIIASTLLGIILNYANFTVITVSSKFQVSSILPQFELPTLRENHLLTIPSLAEMQLFLLPAGMIAVLAALESLLSAKIADNLTQTKHQPNAELNGIGVANILAALASGIPATAAIARTATNIQYGAKSPIAGILHAIMILIYMLLLLPFINIVPLSALAAILLVTAFYMSHAKQFLHILISAHAIDKLILCSTFIFTVCIDMVVGISIGISLLLVLTFLKRIRYAIQLIK